MLIPIGLILILVAVLLPVLKITASKFVIGIIGGFGAAVIVVGLRTMRQLSPSRFRPTGTKR